MVAVASAGVGFVEVLATTQDQHLEEEVEEIINAEAELEEQAPCGEKSCDSKSDLRAS